VGNRAAILINTVLTWIDEHPMPNTDDEPDTQWGNWMQETAGTDAVPAPTDELKALLSAIDEVVENDQGLGRYLNQIMPLGKDLAAAASEGVRIMTTGGAKGLTVQATIVAALEEGIVPRPDGDLSEERRLLYVGMTRAKKYLFGTWARRRRGPTARAGAPNVAVRRRYSSFLEGGPVASTDGETWLRDWRRADV
jgi:DNA helicase-2/ATP-dependent DNA helicase PcrA